MGDAVTHDVRGVALGVATLLFLVGGSIGSAAVAGLGDVVGVPGSLAILAAVPAGWASRCSRPSCGGGCRCPPAR